MSEDQTAHQLADFNRLWSDRIRWLPRFAPRRADGTLPESFSSWDEFTDFIPVTSRATLRDRQTEFADPHTHVRTVRKTGGTNSEPLKIPASRVELHHERALQWLGRSWWGVRPSDPLFLIWGHAHLLGNGLKRHIGIARRLAKDNLLGYTRQSSYELNPESLYTAGARLLASKARYIIGPSTALARFAANNRDRAEEFAARQYKAVIATAEPFQDQSDAHSVADTFSAPVVMEYGAAETGVISYSHPGGGQRTFWRAFFIEVTGNGDRILVTTLYPRAVPLLRYDIGDVASLPTGETGLGVLQFDTVSGLSRPVLRISPEQALPAEALIAAAKNAKGIREYQIVQHRDSVELLFVADGHESYQEVQRSLKDRLMQSHDHTRAVPVRSVTTLHQTIAGKTPLVYYAD